MTDDLITFLRARLDDDERIAKAATTGPWSVNDESFAESIRATDGTEVVAGGRWGGEAPVFESTEDALHIAAHDPARTLLEIEAKRQLLADALAEKHVVVEDCWYTCPAATEERDGGETCNDADSDKPCNCGRDARVERRLRLLAMSYADHPDHREEWRP